MTKDDFQRWKFDGKEVWNVVRNLVRETEYQLAREAGLDNLSDRYKAGIIKGMELVLDIDWEDETNVES